MGDPRRVPAGALAPYALRYTLTSVSFDLTKATAGTLVFVRAAGKGLRGTWAATLENVRPRSLDLVHAFVAGDVPDPDQILIEPRLTTTLGPGPIVGATRTLIVYAHPGLSP